MHGTVNELLKHVIPHIPENLISKEVIAVITTLNDRLPAELVSGGLFECPLGVNNPVSDLSLIIDARAGREILAGKMAGLSIDASLSASPVWRQIRYFCEMWSLPEGVLYDNISKLWLEFDLDSMRRKVPLPGVFFSVSPQGEKGAGADEGGKYRFIIDGLEYLGGRPLKKEIKDKVLYCLDAFPDHGGVAYAALMLSRPVDAVRLVVDVPEEKLEEYLTDIRYPGDSKEACALASELGHYAHLRYNLDISRELLPKIGIECFLKGEVETRKERWATFLDHLAGRYPAIREKSDFLLSWSGHTYAALPCEPEPSYIFRRISHLKFTCEKERPLLIKAYPEFNRVYEIDLLYEKLSKESR